MKKSELRSVIRSIIKEQVGMGSGADPNQLLADAGQYCPPNQGYMQGFGPICNISCPNQNDQALMDALGQGGYYSFVFNVCGAQYSSSTGQGNLGNNCCTGIQGWHNDPLSTYMYFFDQVCDGNGGYNFGYYPWSGAVSMPWYVPASDPSSCTSQCEDFGCQGQGGCTDPNYVEYDANATFDDGSCDTIVPIVGCMDSTASNFDPNATASAPGPGGGCEWECTDPLYSGCGQSTPMPPTSWPPGVTDACEAPGMGSLVSLGQAAVDAAYVEGCTDSSADNYNPNATGCLATAQSFGAPPAGTGTGYVALGEYEANLCGTTYTGITDPDNTDCCTYSSTSGNTNYMPGGVGNVTGPAGPTATLSTKDMDLSKPPQAGGSSADMAAKKDRMQKLANIKPPRKK